jgi:hypothetical protein
MRVEYHSGYSTRITVLSYDLNNLQQCSEGYFFLLVVSGVLAPPVGFVAGAFFFFGEPLGVLSGMGSS